MPLRSIKATASGMQVDWFLERPRTAVWRHLTAGELLAGWLGRLVGGRVEPGTSFTLQHGDGYRCRSVVTEFEHDRTLAYSWEFPDEPASHVTIRMSDTEGRTELRLTHELPPELVGSYQTGWLTHLTFLEAAVLGAPLPPAIFWPLHASFARLTSPIG